MRFATKNGKICFSLQKFPAISPAIQKIASDCGCDAVVHLAREAKNNLKKSQRLPREVLFMLVLMGIVGGSLKITPEI